MRAGEKCFCDVIFVASISTSLLGTETIVIIVLAILLAIVIILAVLRLLFRRRQPREVAARNKTDDG
jgi:tellurite resistance protein TehA-like permease